jgi:LytR cell envelope-related transcriptional attenuator
MANPPDDNGQPSGDPGGRDGGFPTLRALIVLVVFVAVTVLVLSDIHPAATKTASGSTATTTTTTTTTRPTHPTTTTTTIPPNKVPVVVANASGVTGAAAKISSQLATGGWDMLAPVNATSEVTTSSVYFVAGFQSEAEIIASSLHLAASAVAPYTTAVPISSIGTADVVVVAGPDLADKTATSATTTTAAAAATTTTAG